MSKIKDRGQRNGTLLKGRTEPPISDNPDQKPPIFSFEHLQNGFCILDCSGDERSQMLDKLRRLSQQSWSQLRQIDRHGLGYEIIDRNSIQAGIPTCVTEDVKLIAFRAIGKAPMVGFRLGRVFNVLWIDRAYTLYDHG
jgi:hypothetical protein